MWAFIRNSIAHSIAWVLGVLGTVVIYTATIATYALLGYLVYNDLSLSFTLPPITFMSWFAISLAYSSILFFKHDWVKRPSKEQMEYLKSTAKEVFISRVKIVIVLIITAWIYGLVY